MIILDYRDTRPLYEQIVDKFQMLILSGALEPNSRMPSVRSLAVEHPSIRTRFSGHTVSWSEPDFYTQ